MLALRLPASTDERLARLAKKTGRTKSYYAKLAIEEFLEDQEAYLLATERIKHKLNSMTLDEVEKLLGLED